MSWTPTDEQVRNLAIFLWRRWNPNGPTWAQTNQASRDEAMEEARAVLVAVGPHIAAQALRDAASILGADPASPLWDMWDSVAEQYETPVQWLDRRADIIEKEAGR